MKVGFIGAGKMATAIVQGMINSKKITPSDISMSDINKDALKKLQDELKINIAESNEEIAKTSDIIVMAVGPKVELSILESIKDLIDSSKTVLSIAAGLTIPNIYQSLNEKTAVIRIMPNINAVVGEAGIALCNNEFVSESTIDTVKELLSGSGTVYELPESQFGIFTAISGSSPAYSYLYIDSIARGAVKNGMNKELATKIAAQAVLGSAKMIKETGIEPWTLINNVSSPGGTTVAGLMALEDEGFISTVVKGIDATIQKDKDLQK